MSPTAVVAICATVVILAIVFRKPITAVMNAIAGRFEKQGLREFEVSKQGLKAKFDPDTNGEWSDLPIARLPEGKEVIIVIRHDPHRHDIAEILKELPPGGDEPRPVDPLEDDDGQWNDLDVDR